MRPAASIPPPSSASCVAGQSAPSYMMRSIWAVVAGFLFTAVLSIGADAIVRWMAPSLFSPTGATSNVAILALTTVFVAVFAIVGCYITARLAPSHPMRHALILGCLALAISLILSGKTWPMTPPWFNILNLVVIVPYAWLGGRLRERELAAAIETVPAM
jgi:hypothetical protein